MLAVTTADQMATDVYWKLVPREMGPHNILSSTTETVVIRKKGKLNMVPSDWLSLAPQSEIHASAKSSNASNQPDYPDVVLR